MEYIPRNATKKLVKTDQTSPLEKNLNLITAEALQRFNDKDLTTISKMK